MCNFDSKFLCLSETWLADDITDAEIAPGHFTVYRSDRNFEVSGKSRGGGVLFAHHADIQSQEIALAKYNFPPEIDIVAVIVLSLALNLVFIVIYIPPNVNQDIYDELMDSLAILLTNLSGQVIIVGDFNTPHLGTPSDGRSRSLFNFIEFSGFHQVNGIRNSSDRLLDLVVTNANCSVSRSESSLVSEDPLHPTLSINIPLSIKTQRCATNPNNVRYNYKKADLNKLYAAIGAIDWSGLVECGDINKLCDAFYGPIMTAVNETVPTTKSKKNITPPWYTPELMKLIKNKVRARRRYLKHKSLETRREYSSLRSKLKWLLALTYREFITGAERRIKTDPKLFWSFVNSKRQTSRIPGEMVFNDVNLSDPQSIVDGFAGFFSSAFLPCAGTSIPSSSREANKVISIVEFSEKEIIKACSSLTPNLTSGSDLIPAFLVKDCAHVLASPLKILFNCSMQLGRFPDRWKITNICPILKGGNRSDITNYRPISLLPNFSKVFEKALVNKMHDAIARSISPHQHGFCRGRSTTTNLVSITQYLSETLDNGGQVDVIYTDLAKAFDKVDHQVLLNKLHDFGFSTNLLKFFGSYLNNRLCSVKYNGFTSSQFRSTSGVPQGSVLGPTLFLIFINDLAISLECNRLLFADDLKIFASIDHSKDCLSLQNQLLHVDQWCTANKLQLNISKCRVVSYTKRLVPIQYNYVLGNSTLQRSNSVTDLGVVFDSKLRFNLHIEAKVKCAFKMLGFLIRTCKDMSNTECMTLLYNAYVRSTLEYASTAWSPYYSCYTVTLEKVQRRFLKFLYFKKHKVYPPQGFPQTDLCTEFRFCALELRRKYADVKLLNKILNNIVNIDRFYFRLTFATPRENSRNASIFQVPHAHTNVLLNSPLVRLCKLGNSCLPVVNINITCPKDLNKMINDHMLENVL